MSSIKVYGINISPPVRVVLMTSEVLGLQYELVPTNPLIGETRTADFLKVSLQKKRPKNTHQEGEESLYRWSPV